MTSNTQTSSQCIKMLGNCASVISSTHSLYQRLSFSFQGRFQEDVRMGRRCPYGRARPDLQRWCFLKNFKVAAK